MFAWGRRDQRGVSTAEFALVFPLVFAMMFGIVQYGLYFWGRQTAAATAREAARRMSVGSDWGCTAAEARRRAGASGNGVAVTMRYDNASGTAQVGALVEVTVSFATLAPSFLPAPDGGHISEVATARVENIPVQPLGCG